MPEIFRKNGIVLIFAEGICIQEWKLRPLKKGTARMAISAWEDAGTKDLTILPIGVNYSSFKDFNSSIYINVGAPISAKTVEAAKGMVNPLQVNRVLTESMEDRSSTSRMRTPPMRLLMPPCCTTLPRPIKMCCTPWAPSCNKHLKNVYPSSIHPVTKPLPERRTIIVLFPERAGTGCPRAGRLPDQCSVLLPHPQLCP
ncbi:1-acyl-sn-glycerol-3-phosphate acyltransferase [Chitinophaga sedimenti]|uniref:1-acyl-sn-glycerol-3-phosphate acyltransferase n=1 Tax=Chitinophaga sedimenti TaxID=2033606 RepID=UPI0035576863